MRVFALTESKTMPHDIFASEPVQSYKLLHKNAFSLIELLVVISIMAILLALLQTTLRKTLVKALEIQCAGKQKQVGVAFSMFTEDHDGSMPRCNAGNGVIWPAPFEGLWYHQLWGYLNLNSTDFSCPSEDFILLNKLDPINYPVNIHNQSYGYNSLISCVGPPFNLRWPNGLNAWMNTGWDKVDEIKSPKDLAIVVDSRTTSGIFGGLYPNVLAQMYGYTGHDYQHAVSPWHAGISNYLHADGHVNGYSAYEDWVNDSVFNRHREKHFLPSQDPRVGPPSPPQWPP